MKSLLSYELKKTINRPFALIVCIGAIAVVAFFTLYVGFQTVTYAWGPDLYGSYEAIPQDELAKSQEDFGLTDHFDGALAFTGMDAIRLEKEYTKRFEGTWDSERLQQIVSDYQKYQDDPEIYEDTLDEWAMQMRGWTLSDGGMDGVAVQVYDEDNPIYNMKPEHQYGEWQEWSAISYFLDQYVIGDDGAARSFEEAFPLVDEPATYEYHAGPEFAVQMQGMMVGLIAMLMLIAGISPIFSDEVACRTEPMLLAAKYGRDKLVRTKILSGLLFGVVCLLVVTAVNVLLNGAVFGFSGYNMPVQLSSTNYGLPFSLTFAELLFVVLGLQVLGLCAMAAFIMLLSALMRSAIPVIFASGLFTVIITFLTTQAGGFWRYFSQTLPPGAASPLALLNDGLTDGWGGIPVPQWAWAIIVCSAILILSVIVITRKYKRLSKT